MPLLSGSSRNRTKSNDPSASSEGSSAPSRTASSSTTRPTSTSTTANRGSRSRTASVASATESVASSSASTVGPSQIKSKSSRTALGPNDARRDSLSTTPAISPPSPASSWRSSFSLSSSAKQREASSKKQQETASAAPTARSLKQQEYRYSIGPQPVRFPKAGEPSSSAGGGARTRSDSVARRDSTSSKAGLPSSRPSSRPSSIIAQPLPGMSKTTTTQTKDKARSKIPAPPSNLAASKGTQDPYERTATPTNTVVPSKKSSGRTRSVSPSPSATHTPVTMTTEPTSIHIDQQESITPPLERSKQRLQVDSNNLARPSSRIFTSFPFPHPTTPRGNSDDDGRGGGYGFGWVTKLLGMGGTPSPSGGKDEEQGPLLGGAAETAQERSPLLPPAATSSTAAASVTDERRLSRTDPAAPQPRRPSVGIRRYGTMTSSIGSEEEDPSDPYGYRRLAGPALLPSYHEEHVVPRRLKRAKEKVWKSRKVRVMLILGIGVVSVTMGWILVWWLAGVTNEGGEEGGV